MKIALFGGTFDPPHNEHVRLLRAASKQLKADKIIVMDGGQIIACGNHETLMQTSEVYRETYEAQTKGKTSENQEGGEN